MPPTLLALLLSDDDTLEGSSWVPFLFAWIVLAFFLGGLLAARRQPHAPWPTGRWPP